MPPLRLGINIDHVATLRNARGGMHPDPLRAARAAAEAGADGITLHLREDRRHIRDEDVRAIRKAISLPMNLEMAATGEMVRFALEVRPHAVCLVPEKREELTTEGGLDVAGQLSRIRDVAASLSAEKIRVSLFIDPDKRQVQAAKDAGAPVIEIHTGTYCDSHGEKREVELKKIIEAASFAHALGLECHAGHGLNYENVKPIAAIAHIAELNIGHFLMGEAMFSGMKEAIQKMRTLMNEARRSAAA